MNNLPQELVDRISFYLSRDELKNTLLLSHHFRFAAEQYSGAFTEYALTEENAEKFLDTYNSYRFRYLRNVSFATSFPALDETHGVQDSCRDTEEELDAIDQEFTRQINFLFSTIHAIEWRLGNAYGPGKIHLEIFTPTRVIDGALYCAHRSFVSWRVHLLSPSKLPSLASVQCLAVRRPDQSYCHDIPELSAWKIDLQVLLDMSSKLQNLETLQCEIGGDDWVSGQGVEAAHQIRHDWEGPRRDSRHDFARAAEHLVLRRLRHVRLDFIYPINESDQMDQRLAMPNLTQPGTYDPFSSSLRILSYQLRIMDLRVVADETLFWPADNRRPSWPNLESISVMFHMVTPTGTWYFQGLPGIGATEGFTITERSYPPLESTEEDESADYDIADFNWEDNMFSAQYRVNPNNEVIVPFLTAFAKAAALMPSLKQARLWSPLVFQPDDIAAYEDYDPDQVCNKDAYDLAWGLAYSKPGLKAIMTLPGKHFCTSRQLWWKVDEWRPELELHSLFQQIGRREHGEDLVEYWDDEWYGDHLIERCEFEYFEEHVHEQ